MFFADAFSAPPQPALEAALLVVAIDALVGVALFFTISIDAQVMAISILAGRASERPLRLWESIIRARQTFWRMAGAGTLVGVVALFVQLLILGALGGLSQSAEAASILASLLSTIVIAPLAYVATSIVIGDVGAMGGAVALVAALPCPPAARHRGGAVHLRDVGDPAVRARIRHGRGDSGRAVPGVSRNEGALA